MSRASGRSPATPRIKFAVASQNKAEAAQKAGKFKDEIAPVTVASRKGDIVVDQDEYIRHGATLDQVAKLKAAFHEGRHGDRRPMHRASMTALPPSS